MIARRDWFPQPAGESDDGPEVVVVPSVTADMDADGSVRLQCVGHVPHQDLVQFIGAIKALWITSHPHHREPGS